MKYSVANVVAQNMKTILESPAYQSIFKSASEEPKEEEEKDEFCAEDHLTEEAHDESCADDKEDEDDCDTNMAVTANYDMVIDSLLNASAGLDELNSPSGAQATIKLASIVLAAKKKKVEELKSKSKKDKEKGKDKNMAKGKMPKALEKAMKEKEKNKGKDKKDQKKGKK